MIKAIKRWWRYHIKSPLYVYVITIKGDVSLVLFNKWEAINYCTHLCEKGIEDVQMIETGIL